ncbi:zinc finger, CCHC-type containing protein [Tanacetum coccineum]|uniref:Zinc finger, CCHC-type containing protein n=1 Tax=Tanacetum coccineum TaxID=301880 RepID=A0ABQ5CN10_9ASTR
MCDWVDIRPSRGLKKDKYGFPLVNFSRPLVHTYEKLSDDPFIISSQAKQVFYIDDIRDVGWSHVIQTKMRDIYGMGSEENKDEFESKTKAVGGSKPVDHEVEDEIERDIIQKLRPGRVTEHGAKEKKSQVTKFGIEYKRMRGEAISGEKRLLLETIDFQSKKIEAQSKQIELMSKKNEAQSKKLESQSKQVESISKTNES